MIEYARLRILVFASLGVAACGDSNVDAPLIQPPDTRAPHGAPTIEGDSENTVGEESAPNRTEEQVAMAATTGARGRLLLEFWDRLEGASISSLTASPNYPLRPSGRTFPSSAVGLAGHGSNYAIRIRGYVIPPETGDYRWSLSSDGESELWISTDTTYQTRRKLVGIGAAGIAEGTWTTSPGTTRLETGRIYRIEALYKHATGAEHLRFGWTRPGEREVREIASERFFPINGVSETRSRTNVLASLARQHPRVLASGPDFDRLRAAVSNDARLARWFASIRQSADMRRTCAPADKLRMCPVKDIAGNVFDAREVGNRLILFAFMYQMTGDRAYVDQARVDMSHVAKWGDWRTDHFLDTAELAAAYGIAYDWMYAELSPAERVTLRATMALRALVPARDKFSRGAYQWQGPSNWNFVCNGGLAVSALAIGDDEPNLTELTSEILERAQTSLVQNPALGGLAPDGGWHEGPIYWAYGSKYLAMMLAAAESALGGDFGLGNMPGVSSTGDFGIHMTGPTHQTFNFADSGDEALKTPWMGFLGRKFRRPDFGRFEQDAVERALQAPREASRELTPSPFDLIYDAEEAAHAPAPIAPLAKRFEKTNIVAMRSGWDENALFVGFKGGSPLADRDHNHLDIGEFVFDALGERWVNDLGADSYTADGYYDWDNLRWKFYKTRAEGNNTLVLNPTAGPDQIPGVVAPILSTSFGQGSEATATADLTPAYSTNATSVRRTVKLVNHRREFVVEDVLNTKPRTGGNTLFWTVNTPADISIGGDKQSATLTQNGKSVKVSLQATGPAAFAEISTETLVPGIEPPEASARPGRHRLVVLMLGVTNATLRVRFTPEGI